MPPAPLPPSRPPHAWRPPRAPPPCPAARTARRSCAPASPPAAAARCAAGCRRPPSASRWQVSSREEACAPEPVCAGGGKPAVRWKKLHTSERSSASSSCLCSSCASPFTTVSSFSSCCTSSCVSASSRDRPVHRSSESASCADSGATVSLCTRDASSPRARTCACAFASAVSVAASLIDNPPISDSNSVRISSTSSVSREALAPACACAWCGRCGVLKERERLVVVGRKARTKIHNSPLVSDLPQMYIPCCHEGRTILVRGRDRGQDRGLWRGRESG